VIKDTQIKSLPQTIGVFLFKKENKYLYIGKSLNIMERVHNHKERAFIDIKEKMILENSDVIDYIICSSELHALVLESSLIQKYHPPYNVVWKDDKSYLYIKIPVKDPLPRISLVRREDDGRSLYFGPYSSTRDTQFLLRSIRKVVPFCTQKQPIRKPCFYSKLGLCNPCPGSVGVIRPGRIQNINFNLTKKIYKSNIRKVVSILEGRAETILRKLKVQIARYAKSEEFERSLELRDTLFHLERLIHLRSFERFEYSNAYDPEVALQKLNIILQTVSKNSSRLSRIECYDISNLMQKEATASVVVATEGILDKSEYRRFKLKETGVSDFKMLTETVMRRMNNEWKKPDLIVVDGGSPQVVAISRILKTLKRDIPLIGIAKRPDRIVVLAEGVTRTYKFSLHNEGLKLIQQLRDESHRFAKKYHKFLRGKKFINECKF
jgi:excinuclease ABC subunit C